MTKKKQPQNFWIKIAYLFIVFVGLSLLISYASEWILDEIHNGLKISNPVFSLTYIQNTGAAFSLLDNSIYTLIAISIIVLLLLFAYIIRNATTMSYTGIFWLTLFMAGSFCNLFERIQLGYVRDFINLNFVDFPIFNFADLAVIISVVAIIILLLKRTKLKQL